MSWYRGAVFASGAACGLIIGELIWHFVAENLPGSFLMEEPDTYNGIILASSGVIFGFLSFAVIDVALRAVTSFIGSFCMTSALAFLVSQYIASDLQGNVLSLMEFFDSHHDFSDLDSSCCGTHCKMTAILWIGLFSSGLQYQYGCGKATKLKVM